jgi:hypothetical protein
MIVAFFIPIEINILKLVPPLWGYEIQFGHSFIFIIASDYAGDAAPLELLICSMISPKGALSLAQGIALGFNVANTFKAPTGRHPILFIFKSKQNHH